jgi:hypothetical protein
MRAAIAGATAKTGCRGACERSSNPATPSSRNRRSTLCPVFSLMPNRAHTSTIRVRRSRHACTNANRSVIGELSRHGTDTSRKVPEGEAANPAAHLSAGFLLTHHPGLYPVSSRLMLKLLLTA